MKTLRSLLLLCLFLLPNIACSKQIIVMTYRSADYWVARQVDDYFDITGEQKSFVKERVKAHLKWHQQEEIPRYIADLQQLRTQVVKGLTEEDIRWAYTQVERHQKAILSHTLDDAAHFLSMLRSEQINYFEKKLKEELTELQKIEKLSPSKQKEAREERWIKQLQYWHGKLSREQKQAISPLMAVVSDIAPARTRYYAMLSQESVEILRHQSEKMAQEAALRKFIADHFLNESSAPIDFTTQQKLHKSSYIQMLFKAQSLLNASQRQYCTEKIDNLIETLQAISPLPSR